MTIKSQRFGEDKSQVKLADKLLIDHMLTEIIDEFKELLIVSNNKINFHNSEKISIIEDFEKGLGPLGGVLSAMKWIKENQKDYKWIATFPVDTPFFKRQILKDFIQNINFNESDLFFIKSNNTRHNIFGLWSINLLIAAGMKPFKKKIKKFDTAEIMTGGIIPKGFDTIIPIEQIIFAPNKKYILIDQKIKKFDHVRFAGSDYKKGEVVIKKNTIVQPNHILAFKSLGIKQIKVKKKINILFFSTGNEISNKDNIPNWMVRNSNTHYIKNLNQNFLFNFKSGSILRDNHQNIFKQKINKLIKSRIIRRKIN